MRINTRVRYAIRMMTDLARWGDREPTALKEVAQRQNLPKLYLSQLVAPLKRACLLRSVWGNKGGYSLARPASEIRLLDIIEAVDGPVALIDCLADAGGCERADYCECIAVWRDINQAVVGILEKHTLADLAGDAPPSRELCRIISPAAEAHDEFPHPGARTGDQERKRKTDPAGKG